MAAGQATAGATPTDAPDVTIIIPNYQGESLLPDTLAAVDAALAVEPARVEVLVVDDASTDGSVPLLRERFPHVRVVQRAENGGFSEACRSGTQAARAPLLYFLNSDARPRPGFLAPLVQALADERVFAAQSLLVDVAGYVHEPISVVPVFRRGFLRLDGLTDGRPGLRPEHLPPRPVIETLYATGGAMLVRRARYEALGGFASIFSPFYYEDVDLGWRAMRRGWSNVVVTASVVEHLVGATIARTAVRQRMRIWRKRNRHLVVWRNLVSPGELLRRHVLPVALHHASRLLVGDTSSWRGLRLACRERGPTARHRRVERAELQRDYDRIERGLRQARAQLGPVSVPAAG